MNKTQRIAIIAILFVICISRVDHVIAQDVGSLDESILGTYKLRNTNESMLLLTVLSTGKLVKNRFSCRKISDHGILKVL
jgi:hypothetical protein